MSDIIYDPSIERRRADPATSEFLREGSWWADELASFWGDSSTPVTLDTRRAVKTALRVLLFMDETLRVIAGGDGDPHEIARQTLEMLANG